MIWVKLLSETSAGILLGGFMIRQTYIYVLDHNIFSVECKLCNHFLALIIVLIMSILLTLISWNNTKGDICYLTRCAYEYDSVSKYWRRMQYKTTDALNKKELEKAISNIDWFDRIFGGSDSKTDFEQSSIFVEALKTGSNDIGPWEAILAQDPDEPLRHLVQQEIDRLLQSKAQEKRDNRIVEKDKEAEKEKANDKEIPCGSRTEFDDAKSSGYFSVLRYSIKCPTPLNGIGEILSNALEGYGVDFAKVGEFDRAIEALQAAVRTNPSSPAAHLNLGKAMFDTGNKEGALDEMRIAVRYNPNEPITHYFLGNVFLEMHMYTESINEFKTVNRYAPLFGPGYINLGATFYAAGKYEDAVLAYLKAISIDPTIENAHEGLCATYNKLGLNEKARNECSVADKLHRK